MAQLNWKEYGCSCLAQFSYPCRTSDAKSHNCITGERKISDQRLNITIKLAKLGKRDSQVKVWAELTQPCSLRTNWRSKTSQPIKTCPLSDRKAKLHVLPLVQNTRGFGNPCYYERLGELYPISTKLVDKRSCLYTPWLRRESNPQRQKSFPIMLQYMRQYMATMMVTLPYSAVSPLPISTYLLSLLSLPPGSHPNLIIVCLSVCKIILKISFFFKKMLP